MSVGAVQENKNNTGIYTASAAVAGAVAGGTYGYLSKPYLKNGEPSDAFYRIMMNKALDQTGIKSHSYREILENVKKIKKAKNVDEIVACVVNITVKSVEAGFVSLKDAKEFYVDLFNEESISQLNKVSTIEELKCVLKAKIQSLANNFEDLEGTKKVFNDKIGDTFESLEKVGKDKVGKYFDVSKKAFMFDKISKKVKKLIIDTQKILQRKATLTWGAVVATALGTVTYLATRNSNKLQKDINIKA